MDLPSGLGQVGNPAADGTRHTGGWVMFTPLVFTDGLGWTPIARPQPGARAACLCVTAHIHLTQPALPLRDLDARAEAAIRALEEGAAIVTVIDDQHRVDRDGSCPSPATLTP